MVYSLGIDCKRRVNMAKTLEARPYQVRVIEEAMDAFLNAGHRNVMVESPTGSGKTVMALQIAKLLEDRNTKLKTGWVAKRANLLTQTAAENDTLIGVKNIRYLSMFDKNPPEEIDFLIVDEAHNDATSTMNFIHETVKPKMVLGLSATPFRRDKARLCYGKTIKEAGYCSLIRQGYLAKYNHYIMDDYKPKTVAETYIRYQHQFGKTVMFFLNRAQAEEAAIILKLSGVRAETIYGSHSNREKEEILNRFQNNETDVLINLFLLTEGFDCPDLQTVFVRDVLPQTKGAQVQMAGRVLRQFKKQCGNFLTKNIVQSKLSGVKFDATARPDRQFTWTLDDWTEIETNPKAVQNKAKETRAKALAMRVKGELPDMPEFILKKQAKIASERRRAEFMQRRDEGGDELGSRNYMYFQG
jgi:superfamily II DNA or RNA helicase